MPLEYPFAHLERATVPEVDQRLRKQATDVELGYGEEGFWQRGAGQLLVHFLHIGHVGPGTDELDVHERLTAIEMREQGALAARGT